ncbi:hypothetical protein V6N11_068994 [Hibiscus sabdariffa]|uniref:Uncharacterized protein n=1 Tax=Hibiscus sabdariffa TaxID=183260 RepID=A0ABR2A1N8_9ROSI
MADSSGDSNWSLFQHMLPYHVLLRIAAIKAPTVQVGNDIMGCQNFEESIVWKVVHKQIEQSRHCLKLAIRALVAQHGQHVVSSSIQ